MIWIPIAAIFMFLGVTLLAVGLFDARDNLAAIERESEQCQCDYHRRETFE